MRVRVSSYILAGSFTLFGLWCLTCIPKFLKMFVEMQIGLPFFTRVVLAPTGAGWLLVSLMFSALVIWKDLRPRPSLRNSALVIVLAVEILLVVTALFLPVGGISSGTGK